MRELLPQLQIWRDAGKRIALATVVKTWGSAPREEGAMMAISETGEMAGSVSGGCVETAVIEEALALLRSGGAKLLSYGVTNEEAWTVGLACGGSIEIFVRPFDWQSRVSKALLDHLQSRQTCILLTRLEADGDVAGRQMLIDTGGKLVVDSATAIPEASLHAHIDIAHPPRVARQLEVEGMRLFVQPFLPPARFVIVGGVHIAQSLAHFARRLEFEVILIDPRAAFANAARFPHVDRFLNMWPDEALAQIGIDQNTFLVALTHDPKIDDPALLVALRANPAYVGILGSRRTHEKRIRRLQEAGLTEAEIARLHAPIGVDIGARSPAEIAVSIMAEVIAVRRGG